MAMYLYHPFAGLVASLSLTSSRKVGMIIVLTRSYVDLLSGQREYTL
jgi:hypothetical protein